MNTKERHFNMGYRYALKEVREFIEMLEPKVSENEPEKERIIREGYETALKELWNILIIKDKYNRERKRIA